MAGTVFLSCGQNDRELRIAKAVKRLLKKEFNLEVFVARGTNNFRSLNEDVLRRLAYTDYFIFINFHRKGDGFAGSVYSHQELAMALALGHRGILVFSEERAPNAGVIQFMVQNRPPFSTQDELLKQIRNDVAGEQWQPEYSRFLSAKKLVNRPNVTFTDGAGNILSGAAIGVVIENSSNDLQDCVIITLEKVDGKEPQNEFRSPMKVSGQRRYDATIPPESYVTFDILMQGKRAAQGVVDDGVFLVSALDSSPLPALFSDRARHTMEFRLDARAHRPIRFKLARRNGEYALA